MSEYSLSPAQIEQYRTEGYVVVPKLFAAADLRAVDETIREMTRAALGSDDYSKVLEIEPEMIEGEHVPRRIFNPFEQHATFRKMGTDPRVLDAIESLIGPNIDIQHSKLNMKPARVGSPVEWHQDLTYFPHTNSDLVSTLVYLDEATEENGCLQVLPRQHHRFLNHTTPSGDFAGMIMEPLDDLGAPVPLPAPAGSVIFMHCMLPHTSLPNRSTKARRTLIFEYRASDAFPIYYGERVMLDEAMAHHLRGETPRFARMGNVPTFVPQLTRHTGSLYAVQDRVKAGLPQA